MNNINKFLEIIKRNTADRVVLITNHYRISGNIYDCEECNSEVFINLTNATICMQNEVYDEHCDSYTSSCFDRMYVNLQKVVAFSFQKS